MHHCHICQHPLGAPIFQSPRDVSITSLCEVRPGQVQVWFCRSCGHLQTGVLTDLQAYYDQDYKILIESEEEDQLYALVDGRKIYRTDHQVETLLKKVPLADGAKVLDYGCAKSSTLRKLVQRRPGLVPHAFDVSEMYVPFWERFLAPQNWAVYRPKPEWEGSFDLVTSFFALEHVAEPRELVTSVSSLLKPGGCFYCIVPNAYVNMSDFVVADHVNHFSEASLRHLFATAGMEILEADAQAHTSAWVVVARKQPASATLPAGPEVQRLERLAQEMASFWSSFAERVQRFEAEQAGRTAAIYGSGFYGTFIATCLKNMEPVSCFLDQNPHRQKQKLMDRPILPPDALPQNVSTVYVGLNPLISRTVADLPVFQGRKPN
jgi:SAM-dependent methyltransferase